MRLEKSPSGKYEGLSIIVVDDDAMLRNALKVVLEQEGSTVLAIDDASSADNTAQIMDLPTLPDVIISDYRLESHQNGVDAIGRIHEMLHAKIPAFILTGGTGTAGTLEEIRRQGIPVVRKPANMNELMKQIDEVLWTSL